MVALVTKDSPALSKKALSTGITNQMLELHALVLKSCLHWCKKNCLFPGQNDTRQGRRGTGFDNEDPISSVATSKGKVEIEQRMATKDKKMLCYEEPHSLVLGIRRNHPLRPIGIKYGNEVQQGIAASGHRPDGRSPCAPLVVVGDWLKW